MSEANEQEQRHPDPADALADMAAETPREAVPPAGADAADDPSAALIEMAVDPKDSAADLDRLSASAGQDQPAQVAELAGVPGAEADTTRRARQAALHRQRARAAAHGFKKGMLPFLVVVAGLLILVGILGAIMVLGADRQERAHSRWCYWMGVLTIISFPVAAALAFGAWWFHRQIRGR